MPIIKHGGKIVYFAHVPKCGGTSIEKFLEDNFGEISFFSGGWLKIEGQKWSQTSPQHIEVRDLERIFSPNFFDASFCVVRHPAERFLSAFNHNRLIRNIHWRMSAEKFLSKMEKSPDFFGSQFDNHFLPASRLVPTQAKIFRKEDGFDAVKEWLMHYFGLAALDASIGQHNKKPYEKYSENIIRRAIKKTLQPKIPTLDPELCERIFDLYSEDYDRFGYSVNLPPKPD